MAVSKNNNATNNNDNIDSISGFKTVAFGFDKNDVTMYIASLRKKIKQMEEEFDQKLTLAMENPVASNEALKRERENIRAEVERTWSDKINDRNLIIKQQQRDLDEMTSRAEDLKVKNEALRNQLSSAISAAAAANANRKHGAAAEEDSEEVAKANADVLAQAEENKALAEEYRSRSEKFKKLADEYKTEIDQFKYNTYQYKQNALQYKENAEQHKANGEAYKTNAEQYKTIADQYKENAEKYKTIADQYKSNAEKYKVAADQYKEWAEKYKSDVDKLQAGVKDLYDKLKESLGPIAELAGKSASDSEKIWDTVSNITFEEIPSIDVVDVQEPEEIDISEPEPVQITEPEPVKIIEPEITEPGEPKSVDELSDKLESVASESAEANAAAKVEEQMANTKTAEKDTASPAKEASSSASKNKNSGKEEPKAQPAAAAEPFDPFADDDDDLSSLLADPSAESVIRPAGSQTEAIDDFADLLASEEDDDMADDLMDFLIADENEKTDTGSDLDPSLISEMVIDSSYGSSNGDLEKMLNEEDEGEYSQFDNLFVSPSDDSDNTYDFRAENGNSMDELKGDSLPNKKPDSKKEDDPFDFTFNGESDDDDMSTDL